ncbi:MAG: putative peptide modification system cyclase [Xanthomonadales bacterium]|nr:putative peptide modification system cyclase [Xanthomonadales bacterium]
MNAGLGPQGQPQSSASSVLRTLVLCDLVNSTALVERLGDREAAELIRKHDRLARTLTDRHGGREIDKTDGFMMMFDRPVQAVAYALDYQRGLRQLNAAENTSLSARVGIHVGDVVVWDNSSDDIARGAKPVEVEGLVKPITSRLMSLALPGQILLSNIAYDLAHRAQGELGEDLGKIRWRTHGRYRFRGVPDPVAVFEIGEEGLAPLKAPPWSSKAHREVPFWRRPATVVFESLVVAALIVVPIVMFLRPDPAIAFASRDWVVVGSLHNLTSEAVFDDALESALRIGLEQSRYVNVMPDLKVRDTITRMQRDPDKTEIDREVGSEVAIRDGARALILPTIAEIGGRVRITAEVIDPQTQTTVYSETADGIGKESILPSLDAINSRLRVRLGEALATVSNESIPLEKVATGNLNALRAYTMGCKAYDGARDEEATRFYRQALTLDPDFALARVGLAKVFLTLGKNSLALEELNAAHAAQGRMSPRDSLYVNALLSTANEASQNDAIENWKVLAGTYPDFLSGQALHAYYLWWFGNRIKEAIEPGMRAVSSKNPNPANSELLLGTLYLASERYEESLVQFSMANSAQSGGLAWTIATAHAAALDFDAADSALASRPAGSPKEEDESTTIVRAAIFVDRGEWDNAYKLLGQADQAVRATEKSNEVELSLLGIKSLPIGDSRDSKSLAVALRRLRTELKETAQPDRYKLRSRALFGAYLAARARSSVDVENTLKAVGLASGDQYPTLANLLAVVEAEMDLAKGKPQDALRKLQGRLDGNELFVTHVTLMDAHASSGDFRSALAEANWLARNRGRAYAELNVQGAVPFNIAMSDLAILNAAEYAAQIDDKKSSRQSLEKFLSRWPAAIDNKLLGDRIRKLKTTLNPQSP